MPVETNGAGTAVRRRYDKGETEGRAVADPSSGMMPIQSGDRSPRPICYRYQVRLASLTVAGVILGLGVLPPVTVAVEALGDGRTAVAPARLPRFALVGIIRGGPWTAAVFRDLDRGGEVRVNLGGEIGAERLVEVGPYFALLEGEGGRRRFEFGEGLAINAAPFPLTSWPAPVPSPTRRYVEWPHIDRVIGSTQFSPAQREGGKFGLRVNILDDRSRLAEMGLEMRDVILRANGTAVDPDDDGDGLWRRFHADTQVVLDVERSGKPVRLWYWLR